MTNERDMMFEKKCSLVDELQQVYITINKHSLNTVNIML